jgi:hypothetical protein
MFIRDKPQLHILKAKLIEIEMSSSEAKPLVPLVNLN